jgi:glycosyltransferase involved in cell wall biosynthesis
LSRRRKTPYVTTLHGRLDIPDLEPVYREFQESPVVSISDFQRYPLPFANWQATVYHGLPEDLYTLREETGKYLAFLGRTSPEKGLDKAIEIANRAGMELRICAKVDNVDREFFQTKIKPLLKGNVHFLGEVGENEKGDFLGNAYALLFPIDWPEPFGIVMIEAMACGTPVLCFPGGSVPEVIEDGVTGFIVEDVRQAVQSLERVPGFDRRRCRERFEERFSARRMTRDYLAVYDRLIRRMPAARSA